jgi:nucleotide-binding universal stress UspA family protein
MKFMVCYDSSTSGKAALELAQEHAKVWNAKLLVVNSISRELPLKHSFIKEAEQKLGDEIDVLLKGAGSPYETHVLVGSHDVGEQLVEFAKGEKINQIFIGIIKKSKVGKLLFGSTVQHVILRAPCPVVTTR